ncbi:hypothetical protein LTR56_019360 [Elasticomyces elasticus]|nr:hypothetical protein LTR56_019360 [Elasticomyces elasticus]KAK3658602.1 hypothetical protein LTR22_008774 [Elasticomyces elasticus]KAK4911374.1 hypothetical protein LTR49_020025 [Elasticomyces elasticus]KAK5747034.1 hypothetical protein LTS12_022500 [Elasticomyces elasticus]
MLNDNNLGSNPQDRKLSDSLAIPTASKDGPSRSDSTATSRSPSQTRKESRSPSGAWDRPNTPEPECLAKERKHSSIKSKLFENKLVPGFLQ